MGYQTGSKSRIGVTSEKYMHAIQDDEDTDEEVGDEERLGSVKELLFDTYRV